MGETQQPHRDGQDGPIQPTFNRAIRIEARRERLTADAGVLMLRELMERTGLIDWLAAHFTDSRNPDLITHPMSELLRTALTLWSAPAGSSAEASGLCRFTGLCPRQRAQPALLVLPAPLRRPDRDGGRGPHGRLDRGHGCDALIDEGPRLLVLG